MNFIIIANSISSVINFRFDLLKEIQSHGYTVHVVAPEYDNKTIEKLEKEGFHYHQIQISRAGLNPIKDLSTLFSLYKLIKQVKPDKVLGYTIKPVVYGSLATYLAKTHGRYSLIAGLGYAFTEDGKNSLKRKIVNRVARLLYRQSLNRCHTVFFQNPDDERLFRNLKVLKDDTKSKVVNGSGVNLAKFTPSPLPDKPVFILVARLLYDKGVREYAAAANILKSRYPNAVFNIVGYLDDNPKSITESELNSWILGGYINYLGKLSDVRPALSDAGVFVLPSFYREGVPRSILEALAMGRAVITTDSPGCRETVTQGKNGFLVEPQSVNSLAAAMEKLILQPRLIKQMGGESLKLAINTFDVRKVNKEMLTGMDITN